MIHKSTKLPAVGHLTGLAVLKTSAITVTFQALGFEAIKSSLYLNFVVIYHNRCIWKLFMSYTRPLHNENNICMHGHKLHAVFLAFILRLVMNLALRRYGTFPSNSNNKPNKAKMLLSVNKGYIIVLMRQSMT